MLDNVAWLCTLLGGLVLLVGWGLLQPGDDDDDLRRRRSLLAHPTRPKAGAHDDEVVELRGRVVVDEGAPLLVAPFSKREVVWMRIDVDEVQRAKGGAWNVRVHAFDETRSVPFHLDDGSGNHARISLEGATVLLERQLVMNQTVVQSAPPEALAYLAAKSLSPLTHRGTYDKKMWFYERAIRAGDELVVVGRARSVRSPPEDYRNAATRVHLAAAVGRENDLVVTRMTESRLLATIRPFPSLGWSMTVLGALSVLLGIAAFLRDYAP